MPIEHISGLLSDIEW